MTEERIDVGVWFPLVKAGTGSDVYTIRLVNELNDAGIKAEICWLPKHAEYLPLFVKKIEPPSWATHVHVNSWLPAKFIPNHLVLIVTAHLCVHDINLAPYKNILQNIYHRFWIKRLEFKNFKNANATIFVSKNTFDSYKNILPISSGVVIPNWVDVDKFKLKKDKKKNNKIRLLYVGNLSNRKGSDLLPKIAEGLRSKCVLYYTGNSSYFSRLSIPRNMKSIGFVKGDSNILKLYNQCDILIFPTRMEGLSLVALESMSSGLPIVSHNASSMSEIIDDGKNGYLCNLDNIEEFILKLKSLIDNPKLLKDMGETARKTVVENFSKNGAIEKYINLYLTT